MYSLRPSYDTIFQYLLKLNVFQAKGVLAVITGDYR